MRTNNLCLLALLLVFSLLHSCSDSDYVSPNPAVFGIAATGAAIPNSPVTLIDSAGITHNGTTDGSGAYSIAVFGWKTAPFLISVNYNGGANTLYSFAAAPGTANINPLTNLAVYQALDNDPATTFTDGADPATISMAMATLSNNINNAITTIKNNLLANYPAIASVDPISSDFYVDEGLDLLLAEIKVQVVYNATGVNVTITDSTGTKTIFSGNVANFNPANISNLPTITFPMLPLDFEANCRITCDNITSNIDAREQCYSDCTNITENPNTVTTSSFKPRPKKCGDIKKAYRNCLDGAGLGTFLICVSECELARDRLKPCGYDCWGPLP